MQVSLISRTTKFHNHAIVMEPSSSHDLNMELFSFWGIMSQVIDDSFSFKDGLKWVETIWDNSFYLTDKQNEHSTIFQQSRMCHSFQTMIHDLN